MAGPFVRSSGGAVAMSVAMLLYLLLPVLAPLLRPFLGAILLADRSWWVAVLWGLVLSVLLLQSSGWSYLSWDWATGRFYNEVRSAFIAAGGFLIGYVLPGVVCAAVFAIYAVTAAQYPDPLAKVRGPWWFLLVAKVTADVVVISVGYMRYRLLTR